MGIWLDSDRAPTSFSGGVGTGDAEVYVTVPSFGGSAGAGDTEGGNRETSV